MVTFRGCFRVRGIVKKNCKRIPLLFWKWPQIETWGTALKKNRVLKTYFEDFFLIRTKQHPGHSVMGAASEINVLFLMWNAVDFAVMRTCHVISLLSDMMCQRCLIVDYSHKRLQLGLLIGLCKQSSSSETADSALWTIIITLKKPTSR